MPQIVPTLRNISDTWRYGLVGGLVSVPLTSGLYWLSGAGTEISLSVVALGGLLAGYLAGRGTTDANSVAAGSCAGAVGGVPGLWLLSTIPWTSIVLIGPAWFRSVMIGLVVVTITAAVLTGSILIGFLGALVGDWLAAKLGSQPLQPADA